MQTLLIVEDNPVVAEGLSLLLSQTSRRVIAAPDIASAGLLLDHMHVDAVLSDIRLSSDFRFEGLEFIDEIRKKAPNARIVLMTGSHINALEEAAITRGAHGLLRKPFSLDAVLALLEDPGPITANVAAMILPTIDDMISRKSIRMAFQPIVRFEDHSVIGYEALARPNVEILYDRPDVTFRYASLINRTSDLEIHCIEAAIDHWSRTTGAPSLFMNVHPSSLASAGFSRRVLRLVERAAVDPGNLTLEITEQGPLDFKASLANIEDFRAAGILLALDDVGVAFSHLPYLEQIRPAWMKISQVFGSNFEQSDTRRQIVRNISALADGIGCDLILEGIETTETLDAAREENIRYGQGYLLGRPLLAETIVPNVLARDSH
ncbi:MAG: EAL domain-containing response regulator [Acidobacteria bacterium]|nr:EAL domain-containing response regulator [Acidobacteriota bacterium]